MNNNECCSAECKCNCCDGNCDCKCDCCKEVCCCNK